MKYLDYLIANSKTNCPAAFFSLVRGDKRVSVERGERLNQLDTIVSLSEEMELYDKEQEAALADC